MATFFTCGTGHRSKGIIMEICKFVRESSGIFFFTKICRGKLWYFVFMKYWEPCFDICPFRRTLCWFIQPPFVFYFHESTWTLMARKKGAMILRETLRHACRLIHKVTNCSVSDCSPTGICVTYCLVNRHYYRWIDVASKMQQILDVCFQHGGENNLTWRHTNWLIVIQVSWVIVKLLPDLHCTIHNVICSLTQHKP